ncbi:MULTISPECIES: hypothetical protein [Myxococcus]|uniref:Lipoprotein n=1 Tax=Myxococcus llanfairpwllgwyngyllgogerychwyrndrobwllllantysiliogogogochensis TaxID=2590453 RepID=A0A540WW91_9BACT|nr:MULTISPECIES: hypothetical protein [Myxococcus]NTX05394.1 hypothetical protein [Myxococcus sp. CA040A]NTX10024.1 hypothetical protein [Myxococcus sp. CA056]TQF13275.1 hypothetical protein FJV41_24780 [Myxococcus llanfairpwllgwyngyllgogerychwyrndrobwllllantysiliogogogochensis]
MRRLLTVLAVLHLTACATTHTNDPSNPSGPVPRPVPPDASEARRLGAEADKLLEDGRYEDALFLYRKAWADGFRHPDALYYAGVIAARAGSQDEAIIWLERAADQGFAATTSLTTEPSLESVRQHTSWARIAEKVAANARKDAPAAATQN